MKRTIETLWRAGLSADEIACRTDTKRERVHTVIAELETDPTRGARMRTEWEPPYRPDTKQLEPICRS